MNELELLQQGLDEPKILAKILDWGVIWCSAMGVLLLLFSLLVLKERKAVLFSLFIIALSSSTVLAAEYFRSRPGPVEAATKHSLEQLRKSRSKYQWIFHTQTLLAVLALAMGGNSSKTGTWLALATIVGGIIVITFALRSEITEIRCHSPSLRSNS